MVIVIDPGQASSRDTFLELISLSTAFYVFYFHFLFLNRLPFLVSEKVLKIGDLDGWVESLGLEIIVPNRGSVLSCQVQSSYVMEGMRSRNLKERMGRDAPRFLGE